MKNPTPTILLASSFLSAPLHAATIGGTQSVLTGAGAAYSISSLGTSDWAYWNDSTYTAGAPTNEKSGGTLISTVSALGAGGLQGSSTTTTKPDFTFTNGTSTPTGSVDNVRGIFNNAFDTTGAGLGLSITLPTTDTYMVSIWTGIYSGEGTFVANLPNATQYSLGTGSQGGFEPKFGHLYTLMVTPDTAGDTLTIDYRLTTDGALSNSQVLFSGAAVSVVPEPSAIALLSLGGLLAFRRRRIRMVSYAAPCKA